MHILITGGCGFVGSNLAIKFKLLYPDYRITCFDNLKRRGSELNLLALRNHDIDFLHGDIRNDEDFDSLKEIDFVIDCSAEPSVLSGLDGGQRQLLNINLAGTLNIINRVKEWGASIIFLSTSRVYPVEPLNLINVKEADTRFEITKNQEITGVTTAGINENFTLEGYKSIYGASKFASEVILHEFEHFFDINTIINRCGVVAGPRQMGKVDQGVMVLWVARHFWKRELAYFGFGGTGKQVRDVLHIEDLFRLVNTQMKEPEKYSGQIFNVGGGLSHSTSLKELTSTCEQVIGNKIKITPVREDRKADIKLYITDNQRIMDTSDWSPTHSISQTVEDIFDWIRQDEAQLKRILNQ